MADLTQLTRVFRIGASTIPDPAAGLTPEQALDTLRGTFPFLAHATVEGPTVENNQLVYTVTRPPAQTKGGA